MKKRFLWILLALMSAGVVQAQELTVLYRATYKTDSPDLFAEAGLSEELRSNLAKAYKDVVMTYRLTYQNKESDFRLIPPGEKQEIVFMGQRINPFAEIEQGRQNYTYKNHKDSLMLTVTYFQGKGFVIKGDLQAEDVYTVVDGEEKEILGFECRRAISGDGKKSIWFAVHIPIANEPVVCGMNGLVLGYEDGQIAYTATEIRDTSDGEIIRPDEHHAISAREFKELVQKRVERMTR